jgi:type IV secretory pathway VirB2 component (pilin)
MSLLLLVSNEVLSHLPHDVAGLLPQEPPPGVQEKVQKVTGWVKWIATSICVLGVVIAGAMMAIGQRRGEGGEHAARLGWVIAGAILITASTHLIDALAA